jgi:hypothetical protein
MLPPNNIILSEFQLIPAWLTHGPMPVILIILIGIALLGVYINYYLNRVQRNLTELGKGYAEQERILFNDFKSGRITRSEYRRKHDQLVDSMREESRKFTD